MLLWWIKWAIEGSWWHNLTRPDDLKISPDWHHSDNFTIIVSEIAWLALTLMIGLAVFARRQSYELFYYVHVPVGLFFLVAALMHAWSFWYYSVGGLFLWTLDASLRTIRLARAGRGVPSDATFDAHTGVTTLTFERASFDHVAPAQYVFLCVPSLGLAERHPFTISSAPSASKRTLHIKALKGSKADSPTFTDKLAQLVLAGGAQQLGDVRVDGPYGSAGDMTATTELVLVAGGIGITPIISVFTELLTLAKEPGCGGLLDTPLRRVRLIWASRSLQELALFAPVMRDAAVRQEAVGEAESVSFESHLFVTSGMLGTEDSEAVSTRACPDAAIPRLWLLSCAVISVLTMQCSTAQGGLCGSDEDAASWLRGHTAAGRPDIAELCSDLSSGTKSSTIFVCGPVRTASCVHHSDSHSNAVRLAWGCSYVAGCFGCGQAPLTKAASEMAFSCNSHFHTEVFHF